MTRDSGTLVSCMVMVIKFHNFKILSFLLHGFLIPQFQKFGQLFTTQFSWIGNPSYFSFFLDIGRNYISPNIFITITIVSNITVLVSQNIIFFGFFTAMSQEDFSKCLPQPHSPLPYFHQDCLLFDKKYLINFLLL